MKEKQTTTKKSFLEWYKDDRVPFLRFLKQNFFAMLFLPLSIMCMFIFCVNYMGTGLHGYSDATYLHIIRAINNSSVSYSKEDTSVSNAITDLTSETEENLKDSRTPNGGFDITYFQTQIDRYETEYENGQTKLVAIIKDGYFKAIVTAIFDSNFNLIGDPIRNYNSYEEYHSAYWFKFGLFTFGGGIGIWLIGISLFYGFLTFIAFTQTKVKALKDKKGNKNTDLENTIPIA